MCRKRIAGRWPALEREVADEWVQEHALETCSGRACTNCCSQESKDIYCSTVLADFCYACLNFLSACIVAVIIVLIVLSAVGVITYFRSASYKKTLCTVSSIDDKEEITCTCGPMCKYTTIFSTICLKINVRYVRDDGTIGRGLLHLTDEDLDETCTYAPCDYNNLDYNKVDVEEMVHDYRRTRTFDCLYDGTKVMRQHDDTYDNMAIYMMVFASVAMLLGIGSYLFLCCTCGSKYACSGKIPPRHVIIIATRLRRQGIVELHTLPVEERRRLLRECAPEPAEVPYQNIQRV